MFPGTLRKSTLKGAGHLNLPTVKCKASINIRRIDKRNTILFTGISLTWPPSTDGAAQVLLVLKPWPALAFFFFGCGMLDLHSLTRDPNQSPLHWKVDS